MKKYILGAFLVSFIVGIYGCDVATFDCSGTDYATGGPLCYCTADGLLCGHSGFDGCLACPPVE